MEINHIGKTLQSEVKVAQLCLTLCDLMDYTIPGQNTEE